MLVAVAEWAKPMKEKLTQLKLLFMVLFFYGTAISVAQNATLKQFESDFEQLDYNTRLAELKKIKLNKKAYAIISKIKQIIKI